MCRYQPARETGDVQDWQQWPPVDGVSHLNAVIIQGLLFTGLDYYHVNDMGNCYIFTGWEDSIEGHCWAQQVRFPDLQPDPKFSGAHNTNISQIIWAEGDPLAGWSTGDHENTEVRPWSEFVPPASGTTWEGLMLTDERYAEHMDALSVLTWRRWTRRVPPDAIDANGDVIRGR